MVWGSSFWATGIERRAVRAAFAYARNPSPRVLGFRGWGSVGNHPDLPRPPAPVPGSLTLHGEFRKQLSYTQDLDP
jgi:hypothetical protein